MTFRYTDIMYSIVYLIFPLINPHSSQVGIPNE
jgi:hypothetical protein